MDYTKSIRAGRPNSVDERNIKYTCWTRMAMMEQNGIAPFRGARPVQTGRVMTIVSGTSGALIVSKHGSRKYPHSLSISFRDERFLGCRVFLFVWGGFVFFLFFLSFFCLFACLFCVCFLTPPPPLKIYIYILDFGYIY